MDISILFRTWWSGRLVGTDIQGNRYYEDRKAPCHGRQRRWVIYRGQAEASKVPAGWHGWLHYTTSIPSEPQERYFWEKGHLPNLTGTPEAYKPSGLRGLIPAKDYDPWVPPEN